MGNLFSLKHGLMAMFLCAGVGALFVVEASASKNVVEELRFDEMYSGASSLGIQLSDKLQRLSGKKIRMTGFMAPPLKPTLSFFVLTAVPLSICPFCSSDADWPADIVVVKLKKPVVALPFDNPIEVEGVLEIGSEVDEETGFVSLVRVSADELRETRKPGSPKG